MSNLSISNLNSSSDLKQYAAEVQEKFFSTNLVDILVLFLDNFHSKNTKRAYNRFLLEFFKYANLASVHDLMKITISRDVFELVKTFIFSYKSTDGVNTERTLNPRTVNTALYSLSSFFNYLIKVYQYPFNPCENIYPLKVPTKSSTNDISKDHLVQLLSYCKVKYESINDDLKKKSIALRDYLLVYFLAMSLRRNEVVNIKFTDIHQKDGVYYIDVFEKGGYEKKIVIKKEIYTFLQDYKNIRNNFSQYVFVPVFNPKTGTVEKPISAEALYKLVKKLWFDLFQAEEVEVVKNELRDKKKQKFATEMKLSSLKSKVSTSSETETLEKEIKRMESELIIFDAEIKGLEEKLADKKKNIAISPHSFRASFVTQALKKNISLEKILLQTGHKDAKILFYYSKNTGLDNPIIDEIDYL